MSQPVVAVLFMLMPLVMATPLYVMPVRAVAVPPRLTAPTIRIKFDPMQVCDHVALVPSVSIPVAVASRVGFIVYALAMHLHFEVAEL